MHSTTAEGAPAGALNADRLLLAIVLAVASRRERRKRKDREGTLLDECLSVLAEPTFCPNVYRFRPGSADPSDAERRRMIGEAQATMERITPLVRALAREPA